MFIRAYSFEVDGHIREKSFKEIWYAGPSLCELKSLRLTAISCPAGCAHT